MPWLRVSQAPQTDTRTANGHSRRKSDSNQSSLTERQNVRLSSRPPAQVIDRLYISDLDTAYCYLDGTAPGCYDGEPKITHVLSIIGTTPSRAEKFAKGEQFDIVHKWILLDDVPESSIIEYFPEICRFIHNALTNPNNQVLVHCAAGISRSVTAIAAYLIWTQHMRYSDAMALIRINRPQAGPNAGFRCQLLVWRELNCELLNARDVRKDRYRQVCAALGLRRDQLDGKKPNLFALRKIQRPPKQVGSESEEDS